ncbi:MAG: hypothetical protein LQ351_007550 [Letrouitia transgressa]|nr:MAG: hypothetical protein LQ351_007550 [Letrouitia transgressa]
MTDAANLNFNLQTRPEAGLSRLVAPTPILVPTLAFSLQIVKEPSTTSVIKSERSPRIPTSHSIWLAKNAAEDFEALSTKASLSFKAAIEKLYPLVVVIQGDLKYSAGDAGKAEALFKDLVKAFDTASTSANTTLDKMHYYEAALAKLDQILATSGEALKSRLQDLNDAMARYNQAAYDAKSGKALETAPWIGGWPIGTPLLFKIGQNLIDDVSNAQKIADQVNTQHRKVIMDIISTGDQLRGFQNDLNRSQQFKVDIVALESSVSQAIDTAEAHKRASLAVSNQTITMWGSAKATVDSTAAAGWALNKAQYANAILETLDNARFEKRIKADAIDILNALKSQDDPHQSVPKISHPLLLGTVIPKSITRIVQPNCFFQKLARTLLTALR